MISIFDTYLAINLSLHILGDPECKREGDLHGAETLYHEDFENLEILLMYVLILSFD